MKFQVESGDYSIVIDRVSALQAAMDAIGLLNHKLCKPRLTRLTTSGVVGDRNGVIYLETADLIKQNGGTYALQDTGDEETDGPKVAQSI